MQSAQKAVVALARQATAQLANLDLLQAQNQAALQTLHMIGLPVHLGLNGRLPLRLQASVCLA